MVLLWRDELAVVGVAIRPIAVKLRFSRTRRIRL
jgi:hypothetical protein